MKRGAFEIVEKRKKTEVCCRKLESSCKNLMKLYKKKKNQ
jgi:hypothetical protein